MNASASDNDMLWNFVDTNTGNFTHSTTVDSNEITVDNAGLYSISGTITLQSDSVSSARYTGTAKVVIGGTTQLARWVRSSTNKTDDIHVSLDFHIPCKAITAGQIVEVRVDRLGGSDTTSGTMNTVGNQCKIWICRLDKE